MFDLIKETILYVYNTLIHNALSLSIGIIIAAIIKVYIDPDRMKNAIMERAGISIPGSVLFGAFTPLCACGTMAVILSMLTTALPWGPIMAFLTSSPLMSPDQFIFIAGIIGTKFAVALAVASVIIGLGSGYITHLIEKNTTFLMGQARFDRKEEKSGSADADKRNKCCEAESAHIDEMAAAMNNGFIRRYRIPELLESIVDIGLKKVLLYFLIFAAIGFLINKFVPSELIVSLFSTENILAVPLAAIIGLPLYVTGAASLPIIKVLMEAGAGGGAILAFMITGPGTSAGVIAGIATIMKKRATLLYIGFILGGGIILGYMYDFVLALIG